MKQKKNKNLHVVKEEETRTVKPETGDYSIEELEEQIRQHKQRFRRRAVTVTAIVVLALVGVYLLIHLQTYTTARTVDIYADENSGNNSYKEFAGGVLKYSKDGIAFLNRKGEEVWNQSYQIKNPMVTIYENTAAVFDKGGNDIAVFDKEGLKGEIETPRPIEKAAVSAKGIVCTVLKGDQDPDIVCYDAGGTVLVELKTSLTGTGYPLDAALSEDGELLMVSYMTVKEGKVVSNLNYYHFGEQEKKSGEYEVFSAQYEDMLAPEVFFMDGSTSAVVGDDRILIYQGKDKPELSREIPLKKEIKSAFHSEKYIGLILKNEGKEGYELCLYNKRGKKVLSENFTGDYGNVKISGSEVIMYDGKKASVYTRSGIHKFDGEMETAIMEMIPVPGVNKYIVMNANGMEVVRLVK